MKTTRELVSDWEYAFIHGLPRPDVKPEILIADWQKNGMSPELVRAFKKTFQEWEHSKGYHLYDTFSLS